MEAIIKSINDVEPTEGICGQIQSVITSEELKEAGVALLTMINNQPAKPHYHNHTIEIYVVANGEGKVRIDGKETEIYEGDVVLIPPGKVHNLIPVSVFPRLKVLVFTIPAWTAEDEIEV